MVTIQGQPIQSSARTGYVAYAGIVRASVYILRIGFVIFVMNMKVNQCQKCFNPVDFLLVMKTLNRSSLFLLQRYSINVK